MAHANNNDEFLYFYERNLPTEWDRIKSKFRVIFHEEIYFFKLGSLSCDPDRRHLVKKKVIDKEE